MTSKQQHTVLVIDDDAVCLELVATVYQRAGCNTLTARTGTAALNLAAHNRVDLVLLDIHIPGTDSLSLLQQIIQSTPWEDPPVCVALTGESSPQKLAVYHDSGCSRILTKPAASAQLVACLELVSGGGTRVGYETGVGDHGDSSYLATTRALEALDGDLALLEKFRQAFIRELHTIYPVIDRCIMERDYKTAAELAHRLAATAGYCGALKLLDCCKNLEPALAAGNSRAIAEHYATFLEERRQLRYIL